MDTSLYASRRRRNLIAAVASYGATFVGLIWLALILGELFWQGFSGLSLRVFTEMTPPPGAVGGLLNAIVGSLIMTALALLIGAPIGILAGTYMAEYGRHSRLTSLVRFINDILLSAPSIVVGLFIYYVMVRPMGHFSGIAGAVVLSVLVVPVMVRTTEDMLTLVPDTLREAAASIGLPRSLMIRQIAYRAARAGIITGLLLAIARISGETAPLLFTALNNQFYSTNLNAPMASLPSVIFQFYHARGAGNERHSPLADRNEESIMNVATANPAPVAAPHLAESSMPREKIAIRNLNFYYGESRALTGVSLPLYANKATAFIGPSGCGI
jgi:phosphate transport system permease protein